MSEKVGRFVLQPQGYKAFIPEPLPPKPPVKFDDELLNLLSEADRALARLDGIVTVLPNPDLFIAMYVKKEALLSSQIEGTQASLEGVLEFEAKDVVSKLKIRKDTANELIKSFEKIGILHEITGKQRYRKYIFKDYVDIIKRGTELLAIINTASQQDLLNYGILETTKLFTGRKDRMNTLLLC